MKKIRIQDPCQENWQEMTPEAQGRFCQACSKVVIDFTQKSDSEILNFLSQASGRVCGRFKNTQVNRPLYEVPPAPQSAKKWMKYLAAAMAFLAVGNQGFSQGEPIPVLMGDTIVLGGLVAPSAEKEHPRGGGKKKFISGYVRDVNSGDPIQGAVIRVKNLKIAVETDERGYFNYDYSHIPEATLKKHELLIYSDGYEMQKAKLEDFRNDEVIWMESESEMIKGNILMGDVVDY